MPVHHTHNKGEMAELKVQLDLVKKNYLVFKPLGQNSFADLVVLNQGVLQSIQVKYTTPKDGVVTTYLKRRTSTMKQMGKVTYSYEDTSLDWFALYNPTVDEIYYVPREIWSKPKHSLILRVADSKINCEKRQLFAKNFKDLL